MKFNHKLSTAGGKIICNRCQAKSKRSQNQCGRPAMHGKNICNFHGGKSTGPNTSEGKKHSRRAHIKTGEYTQESRLDRNRALLNLAYIEDLMYELKITSTNKMRGAKPVGYTKYTSINEIIQAIEAYKKTQLEARTV